MELTRAGELLRNSALTFKHDEIYLMRMLQDTAKNTRNFAFGATLSVAEFMLPPDLERLICAYPQSHIRMEVGNTRELLSKLDAGELDFAVVEGNSHGKNMNFCCIGRSRMFRSRPGKRQNSIGMQSFGSYFRSG